MRKDLTFKNDIRNKFWQFSILPIFFLSIIFMVFIYFTLEGTYERSHVRILKSFDYSLNSFFKSTLEKIEYIKDNNMDCTDMKFTISHNNEFESIIVLDKNGIVLQSYYDDENSSFKGFDFSNNRVFKKFIRNNKKPFFSNINFSPFSNKRVISYIFEYSDKIYMINLNIEGINKYIQYVNKTFEGQMIVVDNNGKYIVNTTKSEINNESFYNTQLYTYIKNNQNEYKYIEFFNEYTQKDNYFTFMINKYTKWTIILIDNNDNLDDILIKIGILLAFFILVLSIITIIVASKVTHKTLDPIYEITDKMDKFANDITQSSYLSEDIAYPMFRKIVRSFNKMQDKIILRENELVNLNTTLEEKVKDKTKQLEYVNKNLHKKVQHEIKLNTQKEKILFEQSKMAAMGEMIGNIAHQWRQPLSLISTVTSGLKFKYEMGMFDEKEYLNSLDKILNSTTYLSNTIDDFRNFFKKDKEVKEFDIKALIDKSITLMGNSFTVNNIKLEINVEYTLLNGYENELLQALLNILNNAKDALKTKEDNKVIIISTEIKDDNIKIYVQDSAGGIPLNIIDKIYDPYFTTKHQSQGTGIGLFMTKEIITKHMNGNIEIENKTFPYDNQTYTGALFIITIPKKLK